MSGKSPNRQQQQNVRRPKTSAIAGITNVRRARLQRIRDHRRKGYGMAVHLGDRDGFWILEFVFLHKKNTRVFLVIPRSARPELVRQLVEHFYTQIAAIAEHDLGSKKDSKVTR